MLRINSPRIKQKQSRNSVVLCLIVSMMALTLTSCGQADHPPRKGEYGEKLLTSMHVEQEMLDMFNSDELPKPFFKQENKQQPHLAFEADSTGNPYRFVIVARGKTERAGEVEVQFISGIMSEIKGEYSPELLMEEDSHEYNPREKVLLILPSNPFSIDVNAEDNAYVALAGLSKQENFVFEDVELQVWQGKGDTYPTIAYLGFFCILASVLLVVYRFVSGLET